MTMCVLCEKMFQVTKYAVCPSCFEKLEAERWQMNLDTTLKHKEYDAHRKLVSREGNCVKGGCNNPMFCRRLCRSHYEKMMLPIWRKAKNQREKERKERLKKQVVANTDDLWQFVVETLQKEGHEIGTRL